MSDTTGEAEPIRLWHLAVEGFNDRLRLVETQQWDLPTPCEGWTVRDLFEHVQWAQRRYSEILGYELEPADDWPALEAAVATALVSDDSLLIATIIHPVVGEVPKLLALSIMVNDLVGHTWDLARALGVDDTLSPELVDASYQLLLQLGDAIRDPKWYGDAVDVPSGSSAQDRYVALLGRKP